VTAGPTAGPTDGARPKLWVVRHGATAWSASGRHTGRTDVPLSPDGERAARALETRLHDVRFDLVLASPLQRARRTAELAGFPAAQVEPRATEWDYGDYEGLTRAQIRERVPGWSPWTHPMAGPEQLMDVAARADAVIARVLGAAAQRALLVAHGHFLRILAARWVQAEPAFGRRIELEPAGLGVLGWDRESSVITRWNG
jgi:broad specificity phosphatase PhoE